MKLKILLVLFFAPLLVLSCKPVETSSIETSNEVPESWTLIWEDRFEGEELNSENWSVPERNNADWGNYMSDCEKCIVLRNNKLLLRGIVNDDVMPADSAFFLTGGVISKGKKAFKYGKIEIRAKLETARGAWPALWLLADENRYGKYPRNGEIDIMERLNDEQQIYQTVHSYYTLVLEEKENPPYYTTVKLNPEEYNIYGLKWYPDRLVFMLNGEETFTYPKLDNVDPTQWPFDQPFYILMTMQLGGSWVGEVEPDDLPVEMEIDWVRWYQLDNNNM